jgi:tetratricopeptide (TPR) repeat protein
MSETIGNTQPTKATQPNMSQEPAPDLEQGGTTQEIEIKAKPKRKLGGRIGRFFLNVLIVLVIVGIGIFGGYRAGISIRLDKEQELVTQQLSDQFSRALVDIQFGNYDAAKTRLEYIIGIDPSFPGAMDKLTEVMVLSTVPTATPVVTPTPQLIVDDTNYDALLAQAQQLIAAGQWQNALTVLDTLRAKDSTFHTVDVDGMYYFALRNLGVDMIKEGNLEGGIYELTLAERFGPLDNVAHVLRDNARAYINAASFWELDWQRATQQFAALNGSGIWDGTMTATERYRIAAMRYGDQLYADGKFCDAYEQYQGAQTAGELDADVAGRAHQAYLACYPPTGTPAPTLQATSTTDTSVVPTNTSQGGGPAPTNTTAPPPAATDTPVPVPPTDTPVPPTAATP